MLSRKAEIMSPTPRYDIFKLRKDGTAMWIGASENMRGIVYYALKEPVEPDVRFTIFDQLTGEVKKYKANEIQNWCAS
jgi:hypothetical protein